MMRLDTCHFTPEIVCNPMTPGDSTTELHCQIDESGHDLP